MENNIQINKTQKITLYTLSIIFGLYVLAFGSGYIIGTLEKLFI